MDLVRGFKIKGTKTQERSMKHIYEWLTTEQQELKAKHGTPAEFAVACYKAVPGSISMDEAAAAVRKYRKEWDKAGKWAGIRARTPSVV